MRAHMFLSTALVWLICVTQVAICQSILPYIECPQYFEYVPFSNGEYMGRITLFDVPFRTLIVEVTLSQIEANVTAYRGRLAFETDLVTLQKLFEDGDPVKLSVTFPCKTEVPKVIRIAMNDEVICSADIPSNHTVQYTFQRRFTPTEGSTRAPKLNIRMSFPDVASTTTERGKTSENKWNYLTNMTYYINEHNSPSPLPTIQVPELTMIEESDSRQCGMTTLSPENGIVKGRFPWDVDIFMKCGNNPVVWYGGTLISSRTIITTDDNIRRNITQDDNIDIYVGAFTRIKVYWRDFDYHSGYLTPTGHVIILFHLVEPVSLNANVFPVCLWNESEDVNIVGENGYMPGLTMATLDNPSGSTILSNIEVVDKCPYPHSFENLINSQKMCAVVNRLQKDNCPFGRGHGLVLLRSGRWTLRGLYYEKLQCNCKEKTVILSFIDLAAFTGWIKLHLRK